MRNFALTVLIGAALVLVFNILGTLAAQQFGFDTSALGVPVVLLYFAIGYLASRIVAPLYALFAVVLIALLEFAAVWLLSPWLKLGLFPPV